MRYILLLRGINVGGKNKVSMYDIKSQLENIDFSNLSSYINSGNLFFNSDECYDSCVKKIFNLLKKEYSFSIPFTLITGNDYLEEKLNLPKWWYEDLERKDVLFFSDKADKEEIENFIKNNEFHNEIIHIGNIAIFWGKYDEAEFLKTTYHKKLLKQDFYKRITIRNGKTFEKLADFLEE